MKLLFASTNKQKIAEIKTLLPNYEIVSLLDYPEIPDVEETESTIEGNARLKSEAIAELVDLPVFSDDSGLFIDVLDGAPGVHSARWTGTHRDYQTQNDKVLELMAGKENRKAHYTTVIAFSTKTDGIISTQVFEGQMPLEIAESESTTPGFSYDTIVKYNGKYVSELTKDEKNKFSSRAIAIRKFEEKLKFKNKKNSVKNVNINMLKKYCNNTKTFLMHLFIIINVF